MTNNWLKELLALMEKHQMTIITTDVKDELLMAAIENDESDVRLFDNSIDVSKIKEELENDEN